MALSELNTELESINQSLIDRYGYAIDNNLPKFRVVWSTDQIEKRLGNFNEMTEGGIFLRETRGVVDVPKYPFSVDRWILEHLCYVNPSGQVAKELVENRYSYEPLRVLEDKDQNFLPLNRDVVEICIYFFINRGKKDKGVNDLVEQWDKKEKKKRDRLADMIGEYLRSPYFGDLVY